MLKLNDITKIYPNSEINILDQLSFYVNQGDTISIVGPSGTGKTTLLNIMSTLDKPTLGKVLFEDKNMAELSYDEKAQLRNREMGFVFQKHHLLPHLNLLENALVPTLTEKNKTKRKLAQAYALDLIEWVGLTNRIKHRPGQMSVGECQRTAVVRALINKPSILFADEPTGSLDPDASEQLIDLLVSLNAKENLTIIMVTHAEKMARKLKRVYKLEQGNLIQY